MSPERIGQVTIPPLRADLAVKRYSGRYFVEDAARALRVPIDESTLAVMEVLADGPAIAAPLIEALELPAAEVYRRVALLDTHALLDTRRARDQRRIHQAARAPDAPRPWPKQSLAQAPLRLPTELRHGCVASGACCHGTDVGPLKPDDIAKINAIDWSPYLPAEVSRDDWLIETEHDGRPITLIGMRAGRCVFLGEDKLCIIHKVAGAAQKPTICRQFPYTFTRTPAGVDVSFSMECRAWLRAKDHAAPVAEDEATIRALIAEGGPVLELPPVVALWRGVDLSHAAWEALRAELIDGARAAATMGQLVAALTAPVRRVFAEAYAPYASEEGYLDRGAWGLPVGEGERAEERLAGLRHAVGARLADGLTRLADGFDEAGQGAQADRTRRVRWIIEALLSGRRVVDLVPFAKGLELWRDVALASLRAHEPARRHDVMTGISRLILRLLAAELGAGLLAQVALRGRVSEQDAVDSEVLLTKMLRGSAFVKLLSGVRTELVELLVYNGGSFVSGEAATLPHDRLNIG